MFPSHLSLCDTSENTSVNPPDIYLIFMLLLWDISSETIPNTNVYFSTCLDYLYLQSTVGKKSFLLFPYIILTISLTYTSRAFFILVLSEDLHSDFKDISIILVNYLTRLFIQTCFSFVESFKLFFLKHNYCLSSFCIMK